MQFVWGNLIELIINLNPQGQVHAFSAFVPFTQSPSIAFSLSPSFRRRCAVQNLERRELLAGDFTFSSPFQFPYQIIEDGSLFGSIDIETALPAGSEDLEIQLRLEQSSPEASLSLDSISEERIVYITAGETSSNLFLVAGVVDNVADGNQFVSVVASAPGYNDLVIEFEILDAQGGNAKPEVTSLQGLGFVNAVLPGNAISLSGTFADADADDMHTVTVDWGDGNTEVLTASEVNQDSDTFHADHIYSKPGLYDVSVTVSDDVDSDSNSGRAVVVGATLTDAGVLEVVGGSGADRVEVRKAKRGKYYVAAEFEDFGKQYRSFHADDVASLSIATGPGRDHIRVQSKVKLEAVIHAGAGADIVEGGDGDTKVIAGAGNDIVVTGHGNDTLIRGRGNDVLSAGSGNDKVRGGPGFNILVGGRGIDRLVSAGEDIVIGGVLRDEARVCKLAKLMDYWASGDTFEDRVEAIVDDFIDKRKGRHASRYHHSKRNGFVRDDKETDIFRNVEPAQRQWFFADANEVTGADSQDIVS